MRPVWSGICTCMPARARKELQSDSLFPLFTVTYFNFCVLQSVIFKNADSIYKSDTISRKIRLSGRNRTSYNYVMRSCDSRFTISIQERLWRSCRGVIECEAFFH